MRRSESSGHPLALPLGHEFLDRGEHHPAAGDLEQRSQVLAVGSLDRHLAQEFMAPLKLAKKLVVEVVAVGEYDHSRVLHGRVADDPGGVEEHRIALSAALCMPDHADAAVV